VRSKSFQTKLLGLFAEGPASGSLVLVRLNTATAPKKVTVTLTLGTVL
jgi:hypothetical protein